MIVSVFGRFDGILIAFWFFERDCEPMLTADQRTCKQKKNLPDICAPTGAYAAAPTVYSSLEMCATAFVSASLAPFSAETI